MKKELQNTSVKGLYETPSLRYTAVDASRLFCGSKDLTGYTEELTFGGTNGWYDGTETLKNGDATSTWF